jgi:uncharacterized protein involved in response to NO
VSSFRVCEPYRFFFPLGLVSLIFGVLLWVPLLWTAESYPIHLHRYLVLNGFAASFIAGFLMTAIPRFSQTAPAHSFEVFIFFLLQLIGLPLAIQEQERMLYYLSSLQPMLLLFFILRRFPHRKQNPPYTFIFILIGLMLWIVSGWLGADYKELHYEGAIAAIILGVGSRLIPGILGHTEIVQAQRERYERPVGLLKTIPFSFILLVLTFAGSYFLSNGIIVRSIVVFWIGVSYWKLFRLPKLRTSLTWSLWICGWLIIISFLVRPLLSEGEIHISHSFFINGIVLLSLLIAARVIQSHGPKLPELEKSKILWWVTGLIVLAAATRVSAFYLPSVYLTHLAYASVVLTVACILWAWKYLRYS